MDQKTWRWRKRSTEKSIDASNEGELSVKGNEEEKLHYEKEAALERTVKNLHEKVASLLCECNAKDNLIVEQAKAAQEAAAGREEALAEVTLRNQELEETLQQKVSANERLVHLNAALKDYRQQLTSLKEEQDQKLSESVYELERENKRLDEKFIETSKKLTSLTLENAQLAKALVTKEELIEDVSDQMARATTEFNSLILRLDSAEKENGILKYEYRVLERELEIRNRCADVANRQHQESVKRVTKLEAECQKLRSMVKRNSSVNTKCEVENGLDKRMSFMIKRLCEVEEENEILKEKLRKRDDEKRVLQSNRHARDLDIMSLMDDFVEMERLAIVSSEASNLSLVGKERLVIVSSDASNLESVGKELGTERLAMVSSDASNIDSVGKQSGTERLAIVSSDASNLDLVCKELVPVGRGGADDSSGVGSDWLESVLKEILEQTCVSKRSFDELLEDIRAALQCRDHSSLHSSSNDDPISGYITWKSPDTERSSIMHEDPELKLLESKTSNKSLKNELEKVKEAKRVIEDQLENQKLLNEDLDHQISVAKVQINEANHKVSSLKVELEDRSHSCEELEAMCLELQLQLASVSNKDVKNIDFEQEEKVLRTGWEITAASAKLAECQETIFSIGRQLKALAPPPEPAAELTGDKRSNHRSSLRDHMMALDGADVEDPLSSPKTKEIITTTETKESSVIVRVGSCNASRVVPGALAIVPSKKHGKGTELLRKLLFRRKRGSSKKKVLSIGV